MHLAVFPWVFSCAKQKKCYSDTRHSTINIVHRPKKRLLLTKVKYKIYEFVLCKVQMCMVLCSGKKKKKNHYFKELLTYENSLSLPSPSLVPCPLSLPLSLFQLGSLPSLLALSRSWLVSLTCSFALCLSLCHYCPLSVAHLSRPAAPSLSPGLIHLTFIVHKISVKWNLIVRSQKPFVNLCLRILTCKNCSKLQKRHVMSISNLFWSIVYKTNSGGK